MLRPNELSLKDAIDKMLNAYKLKSKVHEAHLVDAWEKIVGPMIDKHTRDIYIKNTRLFVKLDSSVIRQELSYMQAKLIEKVNAELGATVVREIVFI